MTERPPDATPGDAPVPARYWSRTLWLTLPLLAAWLGVTLLAAVFAGDVDAQLLGWPLGYWFGAQGALVLYVVIVAAYARGMDRLEAEPPPEGEPR
jgi:putative solute:sodium symporter small subunit